MWQTENKIGKNVFKNVYYFFTIFQHIVSIIGTFWKKVKRKIMKLKIKINVIQISFDLLNLFLNFNKYTVLKFNIKNIQFIQTNMIY